MRLIDETELKEWVENWFYQHKYYHPYSKSNSIPCSELYDILERLPTIDAVEVVHGEWIHGREIGKEWNCGYWITYFEDWHCSNCGVVFEQESKPKYHFCPNCGASMDGEVKHE